MDRTTAVIDLGTVRHETPTDAGAGPTRPFGPRRIRAAALALTCALLLGAAGDVPLSPRQWQIQAIPLSVGVSFRLTGDRLFMTDPTPGTERRVSAYGVADGRRLWTSEPRPGQRLLQMTATAGLVLLLEGDWNDGQVRTWALDAVTGQWLWSVPRPLNLLPRERTALDVEDIFPAGSLADAENPPPDVTNFHRSSTGGLYTKARTGVNVRAIDLDSGRVPWSAPNRTVAIRIPAGGGRPGMVLVGEHDGDIELRDLRTGAVRNRIEGYDGSPLNAWMLGDSLLIKNADRLDAYSADLRERRWSHVLPDESLVDRCGPMLCMFGLDIELIDPGTGTTAWTMPNKTFLVASGDQLVETDSQGRNIRVLDPHTGRTVVDLTGWSGGAGYEDDSPLLLIRRSTAGPRTWLALLAPNATSVRLLDPLPYALTDCQVVVGAFACRTHKGDTRIWHHR